MSPAGQRIACSPDALATWRSLRRIGSARGSRSFYWPRPYVLRTGDPVALAREQVERGYRGNPDDAPIHLEPPVAWGANPFASKPWMTRLMCLQPMDAFVYAHAASDDPRWLGLARDYLLDWINQFVLREGRAYQAWSDMAVGYRAAKIAWLMAAGVEGRVELSDDEGAALVLAAERHVAVLTDPSTISPGNHGIFQILGLAQLIAIFANHPRRESVTSYVGAQMTRLLDGQFNDEGMHLEHSPHYHWWMQAELSGILRTGWIADCAVLSERLARAEEAKNWLVDPRGRALKIGDTGTESRLGITAPALPDFEAGGVRLRIFPKGGYAVARTGTGVMFLNAAYHSRAHKHADDLHLEWHARSLPVLVDGGTCGYVMDGARRYLLSTRAHNTVQCERLNYPRDGADAFGSALGRVAAYPGGLVRVEATVRHETFGFTHRRVVSCLPDRAIRIVDAVHSETPRVFRQWLHFDPLWRQVHSDESGAVLNGGEQGLVLSFEGGGAIEAYFGAGEGGELNGWRAVDRALTPAQAYCQLGEGCEIRFVATLSLDQEVDLSEAFTARGEPLWLWER